jgi:hypothetical protein
VAPGPDDLVDGAPWVLTVSVGRPTGVQERLENKRLILDGADRLREDILWW